MHDLEHLLLYFSGKHAHFSFEKDPSTQESWKDLMAVPVQGSYHRVSSNPLIHGIWDFSSRGASRVLFFSPVVRQISFYHGGIVKNDAAISPYKIKSKK